MTPYTHADHARRCREASDNRQVLEQFVQVRMAGVPCCAKIVGAWDTADGGAMWRLQFLSPSQGLWSVPAHRVAQCSGLDGRCTCASAALEPRSGAGAQELATRAEAGPGGVTC